MEIRIRLNGGPIARFAVQGEPDSVIVVRDGYQGVQEIWNQAGLEIY